MKATIVSLVPWKIREQKPLNPSTYEIEAADISRGEVKVLVIDDGQFPLRIDENRVFPVPVPSDKLAESIINDYVDAFLGVGVDKRPGLFWVAGEFTAEEVKKKFSNEILEATRKQANWFKKLIELADDDWKRYGQHRSISDIQRAAAKLLNQERPWLMTITEADMVMKQCPACKSKVLPGAAICSMCRAIVDKEAYNKIEFASQARV